MCPLGLLAVSVLDCSLWLLYRPCDGKWHKSSSLEVGQGSVLQSDPSVSAHKDKACIYRETMTGQRHENTTKSFSRMRECAVEGLASPMQKVSVWLECSLVKLPSKWGWIDVVQKSLCTCTNEDSKCSQDS